jgi:mannose-6-phosphate isomerase-like protein (cupin superfamily)
MAIPTKRDRPSNEIGRRAMLERTAVGGAAVAAGLFGSSSVPVEGAQADAGLAHAVTTGRMRRVVSAHDSEGKSFIESDEVVDIGSLWTTTSDQLLGPGPDGEPTRALRPTGASRYYIATIVRSPDPMPTLDNRLGFHRTPGVAYVHVLTGEIVYMVDREEVRLQAGDLVVERGTEHSWRNEGETPVGLLVTVITSEA